MCHGLRQPLRCSTGREVSMPEGGMEEKRVDFWGVHLGVGGGKDVSDCEGKAV